MKINKKGQIDKYWEDNMNVSYLRGDRYMCRNTPQLKYKRKGKCGGSKSWSEADSHDLTIITPLIIGKITDRAFSLSIVAILQLQKEEYPHY